MWKVFLLHVFLSCGVCSDDMRECDSQQEKKMGSDFQSCYQRHMRNSGANKCILLANVIGCGGVWLACHSTQQVRRMRDQHIEALIRQYGSKGSLDNCPIVKEYRYMNHTMW